MESFKKRKATLLSFERELAGRLPPEEDQQFRELHKAVIDYIADKDKFIQAVKSGSSAEVAWYIQNEKTREHKG